MWGGALVAVGLSFTRLLSSLESVYRRGARRWRKLHRANGHLFQAKRFNRVSAADAGRGLSRTLPWRVGGAAEAVPAGSRKEPW